MATMVRVKVPDGGPPTVTTGAATLGVVLADEIAVMVGDTVARQRLGTETKEALLGFGRRPRDLVAVAAGSVRTFLGVPGLTGDLLEATAATELNAVVPTEGEVGVVVGADAAGYLDRSELVLAAIRRCLDAFVPAFGL